MGCVPSCFRPQHGRSRWRLIAALTGLLLTLPAMPPAYSAAGPWPDPVRGSAYMGMGVGKYEGMGAHADPDPDPDPPPLQGGQTEGVDVSSYQGDVAWSALWSTGVRWSYTKATEGTSYQNPYFTQQYDGAYGVGMVRGAYHFAAPDSSGGAAQANYFVDHGGRWSADGRTLPGALDIEWNPYGDACYGKSKSGMVAWIRDFLNRYKARTGRQAVIYTATNWWNSCTGGYKGFGSTNPLWVARYGSSVGELPAGWSSYTMWQYTSSGATVGDHNRFNASADKLREFAAGRRAE